MLSKQAYIATFTTLLLSLTACNSDDSVAPVTDESSPFSRDSVTQSSNFSVGIRTLNALGNDTTEFFQGQQIYWAMSITNLQGTEQSMAFPDPGYPAFCIKPVDSGNCLWDSRFNRGYPQVVVTDQFDGFESRDYTGFTEQVDNNGFAFVPGDYAIRGLGGYDTNDTGDSQLGSPWHRFTITE